LLVRAPDRRGRRLGAAGEVRGFLAGAIGVAAMAVAFLSGCHSSGSTTSVGGATVGTGAATPLSAVPGSSTAGPAAAGTTAGPTVNAAGQFDSCAVVTQAQAAAAVGENVSAGVLGTATVEGGLACVFYGPDAPAQRDPNVAQADSVRVVVVTGSDAVTWYNDYKSKVSAKAVGGYGDQAYYDGYASFSVLKGSTYVRISVIPADAAVSLADEEKLMNEVLPNV
jgi:hypothetical protein